MSVRLREGILELVDESRVTRPSAEQIYGVVFEEARSIAQVDVSRGDFTSLGLRFSDEPAAPAIRLTATVSGPDVEIQCQLAGAVSGRIVAVATDPPFQADYIIDEGVWYPLPLGTATDFEALLRSVKAHDGRLGIGGYLALLTQKAPFLLYDQAAAILEATNLSTLIEGHVVRGLVATPYPYQRAGIAWLRFMTRHGLGTILADEMGLGKTLQAIGVIASEVDEGRRPNLIVCPATLLENWRRECAKFAPELEVVIHAGPRRTGRAAVLSSPAVTVTSYDTLVGDISLFRAVNWNLIVADEAQAIKNPVAKRTCRIKEVPRRVSMAVSGTPVENSLRDLWSVSDFVRPGHLGPLHAFEASHPDTEAGATHLEPLVSAILLRRRVAQVAGDLPARIDIPVVLTLDQSSAEAYDAIRVEAAAQNPHAAELTALVKLRMFCAHPWTAGKMLGDAPESCSPKLERCIQILEEIASRAEKALIFTSFNDTADLLQAVISRRLGISVEQINGSVPVEERQIAVDRFTALQEPAALVLNPKAAGTGLNITAANHVIHYNLEWNPAVEDQASARAYRRGQMMPVTVHRMFYAGTVEEVIDERMRRKRAVADRAVLGMRPDEGDLADLLESLRRSPLPSPQ